MAPQVRTGYYVSPKYASLERFISYYYQLKAVREQKPEKILFIGVGDGLIPGLLKASGLDVTTLDFDESLRPDVLGDIRSLPFPDHAFDLVCAFEVLEHLPFDESAAAIREMARVSSKGAVIAVPHRRTAFECVIKFPGIRSVLKREFLDIAIRFPVKFPGFAVSKQYHWEIDGYTTKLAAFRGALADGGFRIEREETPVLDPYRRFFTLATV